MRTPLAIIIAFVILFNGWLLLSGILHGIGYLLQVDENSSPMYWINLLFMLFVSPIFGGFLSTYITPRLFEGVSANTIALGVISITLALTILISTVYVIFFCRKKQIFLRSVSLPCSQFRLYHWLQEQLAENGFIAQFIHNKLI